MFFVSIGGRGGGPRRRRPRRRRDAAMDEMDAGMVWTRSSLVWMRVNVDWAGNRGRRERVIQRPLSPVDHRCLRAAQPPYPYSLISH